MDLSKITKIVLNRPVAVLVSVIALILFGVSSVTGMSLQLYPDTTYPALFVTTYYPDAGPEEVEKLVTQKIEESCGTISGLKTMTSSSSAEMSDVTFQFNYGTDLNIARQQLQEALEEAKLDFPDGVKAPTIVSMNGNSDAAISLSVASSSDAELYNLVKQKVVPELKKVNEAASVKFYGGDEKYVAVELIPENIAQYKVDISDVTAAIGSANIVATAGKINYGNQLIRMDTQVEYKNIDAIKNIPLTLDTGEIIRVSDVANVHYDNLDAMSYSRFNGQDNISIDITKKQSANVLELSKNINAAVERITENNPDITIETVFDTSDTIRNSIRSIASTLVLGIFLSMLVLFLFFGDLKASLIVGSSMPISLLATFILMSKMGFTLNMITMSALVIGIGMMVDNAIVVIEMCFRKKDEGFDFKEAAYEGTKVVVNSIIASTLTSVVVYLPISGLKGMSGQLYSSLGYTIVFALLSSLVSALTLIPLCFSKYKPVEKKELPINNLLNRVSNWYGKVMVTVLARRKTVILATAGLVAVSVLLGTTIRSELMAATDERQVAVTLTYKPGLNLEKMDEISQNIEQFVADSEYVEKYSAMVSTETANAEINAYLKTSCKKSTAEVVAQWKKDLRGYDPRCDIKVSISDSEGTGSVTDDMKEIVLRGANLSELTETSKKVEEAVSSVDGVLSVQNTLAGGGFKAEIVIEPEFAKTYGFETAELASAISTSIAGVKAMDITVDGTKYNVNVVLPKDSRDSIAAIENLSFRNSKGDYVPLKDMAHIEFRNIPQSIAKVNGNYNGSITLQMDAKNADKVKEAVEKVLNEVELPSSVSFGETAAEESMEDEFSGLGKAIFAAVFLVFMVMAIQFESMKYSGLVMFCIPFSLIGSVILLAVTRCKISMTSLMGLLMLVGIVVNNGILFVDTTNLYRKEMHAKEALIKAGQSRLRPILMTTLTTLLSMLPLCFGGKNNVDSMKGMAIVIIGGLTASTLLTFFLLPTFYMIIHKGFRYKD